MDRTDLATVIASAAVATVTTIVVDKVVKWKTQKELTARELASSWDDGYRNGWHEGQAQLAHDWTRKVEPQDFTHVS